MSAANVYVLSTRALSPELVKEAATKGITIDVIPFIATARRQDEILVKQLAELFHRPLTALFTSTNAVTAIENARPSDWKIFCLNGATRRAVAERFGEHAIAGTADSAAELAGVITGREKPGECWFFCGDKRRDELPERLEAAGWQVHEVVVYQTFLTPHRIGMPYKAILFFSPSAVESFFSMNAIDPQIILFAIGRTTAAAIRTKCPNPVVTSELPDERLLIREIIKYFDEHTQK